MPVAAVEADVEERAAGQGIRLQQLHLQGIHPRLRMRIFPQMSLLLSPPAVLIPHRRLLMRRRFPRLVPTVLPETSSTHGTRLHVKKNGGRLAVAPELSPAAVWRQQGAWCFRV